MFTPPKNEQDQKDQPVSHNQIFEANSVEEQPNVPGFGASNWAKWQREFFRGVGMLLTAFTVDAAAWKLEVQKARLLEAIVRQHKLDLKKEQSITLDVWTHRADLEKYAQNQGYLGDASYMFKIEDQLNKNVLRGSKLVLSKPDQSPIMPSAEERKEVAEMVQRPAEVPQNSVVDKQAKPVLDYGKIAQIMQEYREDEFRKIAEGQDTVEAVVRRLAPYQKIEENVKRKAQEQQEAATV
jgi:hypothetical protein